MRSPFYVCNSSDKFTITPMKVAAKRGKYPKIQSSKSFFFPVYNFSKKIINFSALLLFQMNYFFFINPSYLKIYHQYLVVLIKPQLVSTLLFTLYMESRILFFWCGREGKSVMHFKTLHHHTTNQSAGMRQYHKE